METKSLPTTMESGTVVVWHLLVSLLSGIIIGVLLSYAIMVYGRRRLRNIKGEPKRESHISKDDTIYQDLDLTTMNTEENYQSLHVNSAGIGDDKVYENEKSAYTDLNTIRKDENNYQSIM